MRTARQLVLHDRRAAGDGSVAMARGPTRSLTEGVPLRACLFVLVASWFGPFAHAQDASPHQGLLGDWGGRRTDLYEAGIDFQFSYFNELAYNANGGSTRLARYADQSVAGVSLDLDKLWGWPKATFQLTLTDRNGKNLSADADLGTLMQVQQVYGRGSIVRL